MKARLLAPAALLALLQAAPATAALPAWARDLPAVATPDVPDACPAVVLLDRTSITMDRTRRMQVVRRRVLRILHSAGGGATVLAVRVEPGGAMEDFTAATYTGTDLRARNGFAQRVESMMSTAGPTDVRSVALAAPDPRAGDLVVFEAAWHEVAPLPAYLWMPQLADLPVVRAELEMDLPRQWSARVDAVHATVRDGSPGPERLRLALADLPYLPSEPRAPGLSRFVPRVGVRLVDERGDCPFADWPALARWYGELVRSACDTDACPPELGAGPVVTDTLALVRELATRVQDEIRYVAIELGDGRWRPEPASSTWSLRYGDCKNKAAVLVSALGAHGVPARLVLACTRDRWDVDPGMPDAHQFDHVVVALRWPGGAPPAAATVTDAHGNRWTIFDPTDEGTPLGSISDALGGTRGVLAGEGGGLVQLPAASPSTFGTHVDARLDERGALAGVLVVEAGGPAARALRAQLDAGGSAGFEARTRDFLRHHWARARFDSSAWLPGAAAGAATCGVRIGFHLDDAARAVGDRWIVSSHFSRDASAPPAATGSRRFPVELGVLGRLEEVWTLELPTGLSPEPRTPIEWHGDVADYASTVEGTSGRLVVRRTLDLRAVELPPERIDDARALLKATYDGGQSSVLLSRR